MNTIAPFDSPESPRLDQVGSKALSLITMTRAGMPVPPGFVLTVDFFAPWMAALQTTPEWNALLEAQGEDLNRVTRTLQAVCRSLQLTDRQRAELENALAVFQSDHRARLFAVRSSSPEEDLEGASFAGGYETTLGVTTETLEAAIRHSFASSFDARVLLYKREHGFHLEYPRIALVLQQQVDADSAGVAFSLNPLNNCFDEAVINANHGLGESVVAGETDPDTFVVNRITRAISETRIGGKQAVITLNHSGGTTKASRESQQQAAITAAQVLALTALLEQVEAHYQKPVDIEWAIAGEKIFLLQARPITTYLPLPPEMITAPGAPKRLYANSTLIEQGLQEPLSVLGTDFLSYVLNKVGGPVAEGAIGIDGITFTAAGGYYMNISYALMMGMKNAALAPGSSGDPARHSHSGQHRHAAIPGRRTAEKIEVDAGQDDLQAAADGCRRAGSISPSATYPATIPGRPARGNTTT
jgi:phosphoenolpyruvate synthase/pyruvate phosphate dikinase